MPHATVQLAEVRVQLGDRLVEVPLVQPAAAHLKGVRVRARVRVRFRLRLRVRLRASASIRASVRASVRVGCTP